MKKFVSFVICCLVFMGFSFAENISADDVSLILSGMGIIDSSNELSGNVTRAELAELLVNASSDAVLANEVSRIFVFSDVPYNYGGAGYIRIAALNGYLTAYSDGEFKPQNIVKNEEAITALLKLIGYTNKDFTQSYPYEQLSIAKDIGLTDGVYIAKEDVALVTKNSKGEIESMIIKDVTGDTAKYGILESVNEVRDNEIYTCTIDSSTKDYSNSEISFSVKEGPVQVYLEGQTLGKIKNLEKVNGSVVNINNSYIENSIGEKIKVSSNVVVYLRENSEYNLSTMEEAMSGNYNVLAYYDREEREGGRVRVIVIS